MPCVVSLRGQRPSSGLPVYAEGLVSPPCLPLVTLLRCHRPAPCVCSRASLLESDPSSVKLRKLPSEPLHHLILRSKSKTWLKPLQFFTCPDMGISAGNQTDCGCTACLGSVGLNRIPGVEESLFHLIGWKQQPSGGKDIVRKAGWVRRVGVLWRACSSAALREAAQHWREPADNLSIFPSQLKVGFFRSDPQS